LEFEKMLRGATKMTPKQKATKKDAKPNGKPKKKFEPGDPIIINGGGGLIKTKQVKINFNHEQFGPDPANPPNCNRFVNDEVKLSSLITKEEGGVPIPKALATTDTVTIKCDAANSDITITGSADSVSIEFDRTIHRFKKHEHVATAIAVIQVLVNGTPVFTTTKSSEAYVITEKK
jgi:hypothetical protein